MVLRLSVPAITSARPRPGWATVCTTWLPLARHAGGIELLRCTRSRISGLRSRADDDDPASATLTRGLTVGGVVALVTRAVSGKVRRYAGDAFVVLGVHPDRRVAPSGGDGEGAARRFRSGCRRYQTLEAMAPARAPASHDGDWRRASAFSAGTASGPAPAAPRRPAPGTRGRGHARR